VRELTVKLKCFYTNALSTVNNQEELESCHVTTVSETWWGELHDWSTAVDG